MENTKFDFTQKVVLVTGASSGIGRETAVKFAKSGAKVMLADANEDFGKQTTQAITSMGGEAYFQFCDVSQPTSVQTLIKKTIEHFGQIHYACNNAGVEGQQAITSEVTFENWERVINTNLRGVWLCMKYEIPEILNSGGGAIVNVSSIAGLIGFPGLPAYVASKHGVIGLTKTAALEFAEKNIRVNAVCPGPIMTPMLERLIATEKDFKKQIIAGVPQHKIGQPENVADVILFLCSAQASYITGQYLAIDGGWVAQ